MGHLFQTSFEIDALYFKTKKNPQVQNCGFHEKAI